MNKYSKFPPKAVRKVPTSADRDFGALLSISIRRRPNALAILDLAAFEKALSLSLPVLCRAGCPQCCVVIVRSGGRRK